MDCLGGAVGIGAIGVGHSGRGVVRRGQTKVQTKKRGITFKSY